MNDIDIVAEDDDGVDEGEDDVKDDCWSDQGTDRIFIEAAVGNTSHPSLQASSNVDSTAGVVAPTAASSIERYIPQLPNN